MVYLDAGVIVQFNDPGKATLYKELGFASETALETFVASNIILGVESRVAQILGVTYTAVDVPAAVKLAAYQAAANTLLYIRTNKMGPVITNPQGFNLQVPIVQAFTKEIMAVLEEFQVQSEQIESSDYKTDNMKITWEE
jgi:hypothetical protein